MAHSHKRDTDARMLRLPRAPYVAGGLATLATLSAVGLGVMSASPDTRDLLVASGAGSLQQTAADAANEPDTESDSGPAVDRQPVVSRSQGRIDRERPFADLLEPDAVAEAVRGAEEKRWSTAPLNLWTTPGEDAEKTGVLDDAEKILVTGRTAAGRVEIVVDDQSRWVTAGYLTEEKPTGVAAIGGSCTNGTSVEGQPNIIAVHEAVCAAFPEITSYGTYRGDGEHAQGLAIDIMVSGSRGWEVAEFVRANYAELGVNYVIYSQRIWSVDRSGEGWRAMSDRGSTTANHYDHVHVTTY